MREKVILTATAGRLAGRTFVFGERTTCIIGRGKDCGLRIPGDGQRRLVSRHHCMLDINPPEVRIRTSAA